MVDAGVLTAWNSVRRFMQATCGVVLSEDQHYLLESRLGPVARAHSFSSVREYVAAACAHPFVPLRPLAVTLLEAMTTHETLFFRDAAFWAGLEQVVLPRILARKRGGPLRVWSAACSTGQEPVSLAILLDERFPDVAARTEIIATDVAAPTIERARTGVYSTLEVNRGLGARRLVRYFETAPGGYRLRERLRNRIQWQTHNLLTSATPMNCDLVLCRNVLIYFSDADRAAVIDRLYEAAAPEGFVGVGLAETIRGTSVATGWFASTPRTA